MINTGLLALAACTSLVAQDVAPEIDARIDDSQITTGAPVPPPTVLTRPTPEARRIASDPTDAGLDRETFEQARRAMDRGLRFLASVQAADGSWMNGTETAPTDAPREPAPVGVAITAMGVKGLAQSGRRDEAYERGLAFLLEATGGPKGFALGDEGRLGTYVASSVGSALAAIDDPAVIDRLGSAVEWLKSAQWDEGEGLKPTQDWYGGVGYGNRGRPDLSNTQMMLDALHAAGVSPEDPAIQRALQFVTRTQNLKATNDAAWATNGSDDGGFVYTPANGGESMSSEYVGEGRYGELLPADRPRSLRSYGSMTYAGFKSLLYAGLTADDPRVRAAREWIQRHWTFEENPGLGRQGWYYYLHAMSRALRAAGEPVITTPDGRRHDWRSELVEALVAEQREDGSWANETPRWLEDEPVLATIYATLALQEALKPLPGAAD